MKYVCAPLCFEATRRPVIPESKATRIHSVDWGGKGSTSLLYGQTNLTHFRWDTQYTYRGAFLREREKKDQLTFACFRKKPRAGGRRYMKPSFLLRPEELSLIKFIIAHCGAFHSFTRLSSPTPPSLLTSCRFLLVFFGGVCLPCPWSPYTLRVHVKSLPR